MAGVEFKIEVDRATVNQIRKLEIMFATNEWFQHVMIEFYRVAAPIIRKHIQMQLGHDILKTLADWYQELKVTNPYLYKPPTEVDADQPLILTGEMYKSIHVEVAPSVVIVTFNPVAVDARAAAYMQQYRRKSSRTGVQRITRRRAASAVNVSARLDTYGAVWEHRTHFMELGVVAAIPKLDALLGVLIDNALSVLSSEFEIGLGIMVPSEIAGVLSEAH